MQTLPPLPETNVQTEPQRKHRPWDWPVCWHLENWMDPHVDSHCCPWFCTVCDYPMVSDRNGLPLNPSALLVSKSCVSSPAPSPKQIKCLLSSGVLLGNEPCFLKKTNAGHLAVVWIESLCKEAPKWRRCHWGQLQGPHEHLRGFCWDIK